MRYRSNRRPLAGVLIVCAFSVGGYRSDGESSITTVALPSEPLVGMRDGDTRDDFIGLFCGADFLPLGVNDTTWRAEELTGDNQYWIPAEWSAVTETIDGTSDVLSVEVRIESDESRLIATANGRSVAYRPTTPDDPANDCS